jgi:hypothetical protein
LHIKPPTTPPKTVKTNNNLAELQDTKSMCKTSSTALCQWCVVWTRNQEYKSIYISYKRIEHPKVNLTKEAKDFHIEKYKALMKEIEENKYKKKKEHGKMYHVHGLEE